MAVSVCEGVRWELELEEEEEQEEEEGESGTARLLLDAATLGGRPRFLPITIYFIGRICR